MAISKSINGTTLNIEFQKGLDKAGAPIYAQKSFANLRDDVDEQNAYDVAEAIKGVLAANTRSISLTVSSDLVKA